MIWYQNGIKKRFIDSKITLVMINIFNIYKTYNNSKKRSLDLNRKNIKLIKSLFASFQKFIKIHKCTTNKNITKYKIIIIELLKLWAAGWWSYIIYVRTCCPTLKWNHISKNSKKKNKKKIFHLFFSFISHLIQYLLFATK